MQQPQAFPAAAGLSSSLRHCFSIGRGCSPCHCCTSRSLSNTNGDSSSFHLLKGPLPSASAVGASASTSSPMKRSNWSLRGGWGCGRGQRGQRGGHGAGSFGARSLYHALWLLSGCPSEGLLQRFVVECMHESFDGPALLLSRVCSHTSAFQRNQDFCCAPVACQERKALLDKLKVRSWSRMQWFRFQAIGESVVTLQPS